jgi:iron-sulfur cluster assembly accessory protein
MFFVLSFFFGLASLIALLLFDYCNAIYKVHLLPKTQANPAQRLREITDPTTSPSATKEENPYHHLRITVTSGGCHGFQYMMSLEGASKIDPEEDTIFEGEPDASGAAAESAGDAKVVMDEPSLELLHGSTVDYTTELIGSQFKIVDNPRATSNCGCGTSFDVSD